MFRARGPLVVATLLVCVSTACAQRNTGFGGGTTSAFGGRTTGNFGTPTNNSGVGSGLFGSGISGTGFGSSSLNAMSAGGVTGNAFQAGTFIGADRTDMSFLGGGIQNAGGAGANRTMAAGRGQAAGFGRGGFAGQANRGGLRGAGGGFGGRSSASITLQTQLSIGFQYPQVTAPAVADRLRAQIAKLTPTVPLGSVSTAVEGRTVVLTGSVPTKRDRDLAIRLAKLEPGISEVRSELVIENEEVGPGTSATR
jgi:hypothetical protein